MPSSSALAGSPAWGADGHSLSLAWHLRLLSRGLVAERVPALLTCELACKKLR